MTSVLITAFEPYDEWSENASWLALVELTKNLPDSLQVTTRRYPVDSRAVQSQLRDDLAAGFDFAIHLGQAPGSSSIRLEYVGLNVGVHQGPMSGDFFPLIEGGPAAYMSSLPLGLLAEQLNDANIPAGVSFHAGTFLCNATLYYVHHFARQMGVMTQATFVHMPLAPTQAARQIRDYPSMSSNVVAEGLRIMLESLEAAHESASRVQRASP